MYETGELVTKPEGFEKKRNTPPKTELAGGKASG
jgi:hypothetical protein